jgi:hypothetical protein
MSRVSRYTIDQCKQKSLVRAQVRAVYKVHSYTCIPHTYLDSIDSFMIWVCGPWKLSIARRPCPFRGSPRFVWASAHAPSKYFPVLLRPLWLGRLFFRLFSVLTLTLNKMKYSFPIFFNDVLNVTAKSIRSKKGTAVRSQRAQSLTIARPPGALSSELESTSRAPLQTFAEIVKHQYCCSSIAFMSIYPSRSNNAASSETPSSNTI